VRLDDLADEVGRARLPAHSHNLNRRGQVLHYGIQVRGRRPPEQPQMPGCRNARPDPARTTYPSPRRRCRGAAAPGVPARAAS
jgi:hypothetical protein